MPSYEILVTSASRAHLLGPTLESLLAHVDLRPARVLIHDDAAFRPGSIEADQRWRQVKAALAKLPIPCETVLHHADPPRRLGLALCWLLANTQAEYVLYSQDDFVTVRALPIEAALAVMDRHHLHQIRFNKRATLGQKDTWQGPWQKVEHRFPMPAFHVEQGRSVADPRDEILTLADHWYFQTGLWRVATIRAALAWLTATPDRTRLFAQVPAEEAINWVLDGHFGPIPGLTVPYFAPHPDGSRDPGLRAIYQRTFIWGPIGEDRYIRHIGTDPADWAGDHAREPGEADLAKTRQAWAEIASYGTDREWIGRFPPLSAVERQRLTEGHWLDPGPPVSS